jgi:hypothetical protein
MKKTLLLSAAILVGVSGFSQNTAKNAASLKSPKKRLTYAPKISVDPKPSANGVKVTQKNQNSTMAACHNALRISSSYNANGVGGSVTSTDQNCLSYNADLNALLWTNRGSHTWALNSTSGFLNATIINATTLALDSVITYADGGDHARYPGGSWLNPVGNKDYHNAFACAIGYVTISTGWSGSAYVAKPLWSASAMGHSAPTADSLYSAAGSAPFGNIVANVDFCGAANSDMQQVGNTVWSIGAITDAANKSGALTDKKALLSKATLDATGKLVTWSVDSSIAPVVRATPNLGNILSEPRLAFGPDGQHGYVVFLGKLDQNYGNLSDSANTPIVYQTTNGGSTWNQVMAGYDWPTMHPEILKNIGNVPFSGASGRNANFSTNQGFDLTVDANNVLHYVCLVDQPFNLNGLDSLGEYSFENEYDYINYHPIIWDFMTDGTCWKTMMVDSIISADCSSDAADSTSAHSAMGGSAVLAVGGHITVSRSVDGTKVFYGWADSDPSVTGSVYNTNPDILMKAYDVSSGMVSSTKNITGGLGTCFFPFLADMSYYDAAQSAWVVPAVYTIGDVILTSNPQITYDASSQADYYYTNCGTFSATDFATAVSINNPTAGVCALGIKANNTFEGSISNYPNPFNNSTTIAVTLSENKAVDVKIYNAIGNLVFSKKVNGNVGENTVSFDGGQLSSGVYYYTVTAGNQQATKKMIIQK